MFNNPLGPLFPGLGQMQPFNSRYRCNSIIMYQQSHASDEKVAEMEHGGKILLPHSALDHLTRLHINYPMLFKITNINPGNQRVTHAGVMEFHQEEGRCFMPHWMMRNLLLNEDDQVQVEYVSLPVATYVKFKPQSVDFLDITNARAVLELRLRNFSCLTKSDIIAVEYNKKIYELLVQDLKPSNAVSIIECDMNVEFSPPVGYVEPQVKKAEIEDEKIQEEAAAAQKFVPFGGAGFRSDGKGQRPASATHEKPTKTIQKNENMTTKPVLQRGIPNYDYRPGKLMFLRMTIPKIMQNNEKAKNDAEFKPFSGSGQKFKDRK